MSETQGVGGGRATVMAGSAEKNAALLWRTRFAMGDPSAIVDLGGRSVLILRDIEAARARRKARADEVRAYEDFAPAGGLSADREIRCAQATAECLVRAGVRAARVDRSLPVLYADEMRARGIDVEVDRDLGVLDRRMKTDEEVAALRAAQGHTEAAIEMACRLIARAGAMADGVLEDPDAGGEALTADGVRARIEAFLRARGCVADTTIVAPGASGGDCHERGSGPIRTGETVIIDVFPRDTASGYYGDCTRVVVHGDVPDEIARLHAAVVGAKAAAIGATRAGATGDAVHRAAMAVIERHGWRRGVPPEGAPAGFCSMQHGTGHGVGLEVHEPPLLDEGSGELVVGDALTIEPGLYAVGVGGVRIEDMVIAREGGCENLNTLPEGLDWR